ncbi:hypothetical protein [Pseudomonas fluorescens]|uniref:hypothetical protein n=1 Tax=Pseudomonas fluorescens TaxID=294 RepID=UPI00070F354D|nr:hypothetical protein [Pseudomonas fluorescens]
MPRDHAWPPSRNGDASQFRRRTLDGADLSWLVGLVVTTPLYYWLANRDTAYRRRQNMAGLMPTNG